MKNFLALLNKQVSNYKKKYKLIDGKAFGMWLAIEYLALDENDAFEAASVDGGNDKDIDLFFVDDEVQRTHAADGGVPHRVTNRRCVGL